MKIAIIHDDASIIQLCETAIAEIPGCTYIWSARSCEEAIKKASLSAPSLIVMGLELAPICIPPLMKDYPCAIVVATRDTVTAPAQVFEAMGAGAQDVVSLELDEAGQPHRLMEKVAMIRLLIDAREEEVHGHSEPCLSFTKVPPLVVIGCSTGGPAALRSILGSFDPNTNMALIIIQHVDEKFAPGLANWLGKHSTIPVSVVDNNAVPKAGTALIASANDHLVMTQSCRMRYTPYPEEKPYRPSVDVFFESVCHNWPGLGTAVLLTGMGNDGAYGLKLLKDKGWRTIAQDEETSVVYGMPKAAVGMDAAQEVLPIDEIGRALNPKARTS